MTFPGDFAWLAAPVAALAVASLVLVPLGAEVLRRGVVFIDLAVAQVAACGVLIAGMVLEHGHPAYTLMAAAVASLLGAGSVWWLAQRWPAQREALIGLVYVAGSAVSMVIVAFDPHGREHLAALLAADVLWVSWRAVAVVAVAAAVVLTVLALRRTSLTRDGVFYPLFAIALAAAVQTLGLYLVFALLIGPALWTRRGLGLFTATLLGLATCLGGLALSWALDWPSGACIALGLCVVGLLSAGPRRTGPQ